MKRHMIALATVLALAPPVAQAQDYLPAPCAALTPPPPAAYRCPTPYVEMMPDGSDTIFARNFLCQETGRTLGVPHGGGCGSSMASGWSVPPEAEALPAGDGAPSDAVLRAEIMEHVVDPCYLVAVQRYADSGVSSEELVEYLKEASAEGTELLIIGSMIQVAGVPNFSDRARLYAAHKQTCLSTMAQVTGGTTVAAVPAVRLEPDAVLGHRIVNLDNQQAVFDELAGLIRAKGWACDSLSAVHTLLLSRGFKVRCNYYAYQYRIEDRGGRWEVTLD